jgi:uncharacterized protein (DUF4415 family)
MNFFINPKRILLRAMRQPQVVLPSQSQTTMKMRSLRDKTRQINASQVHQPFGKRAKPTRRQPTNRQTTVRLLESEFRAIGFN